MAIKDLASRLVNKAKQTAVIGAGALGMYAGSVQDANAATLSVNDAFIAGSEYVLDFSLTNDDAGVVYDSAKFNVISTLAQDIYALGNSTASSPLEMVQNEWGIGVLPGGEVSTGWDAQAVNSGASVGIPTIDLTNNGGTLLGVPLYDTFENSISNNLQNNAPLRVTFNTSLLESDGVAGYNPLTDRSIVLSDTNYDGMAVGLQNGVGFATSSPQYELNAVPEPSSLALLGLGAGALLSRRKRTSNNSF